MWAALRDSYVEFAIYMGVTERYPPWFAEELYRCSYTDESRFTFYVPIHERRPDYHEKQLVEEYSVFLRKSNGDIHVTDYDTFEELYTEFKRDNVYNCGIAAYSDDCIEYVECLPGMLVDGYPEWFYEYFTEVINFPPDKETVYFYDTDEHCLTASRDSLMVSIRGQVTVQTHTVFLRNKFGEIRCMAYDKFTLYYDPDPRMED